MNWRPLFICPFIIISSLLLFSAAHLKEDTPVSIPAGSLTNELKIHEELQPLSFSPVLSWQKDINAVAYEIEFFDQKIDDLDPSTASSRAIFHSKEVYSNAYNPPLESFAADILGTAPLYWRVRSLDLDGNPTTAFSELTPLYTTATLPRMDTPIPLAQTEAVPPLLYPVYTWIRPYNAASFEIQIFQQNPEEQPDAQLLDTLTTSAAEIYDPKPRYGPDAFFWRVRALDTNHVPLGHWSHPVRFKTSPDDHWQVAVFGDSISHGGGHISFSPADPEFSWLFYLDFPTINLSQSGDTVESMLERFDQDVLPFHPQYLLVFNATNSLRAGVPAETVIEAFETLKTRCLENGIKPIFLTLPPINPDNIEKAFGQPTDDDWQYQFSLVNDYLRTQVHIDTAAAFQYNILPTEYALDGLHEDVPGKQLIANAVNKGWAAAKKAADEAY